MSFYQGILSRSLFFPLHACGIPKLYSFYIYSVMVCQCRNMYPKNPSAYKHHKPDNNHANKRISLPHGYNPEFQKGDLK